MRVQTLVSKICLSQEIGTHLGGSETNQIWMQTRKLKQLTKETWESYSESNSAEAQLNSSFPESDPVSIHLLYFFPLNEYWFHYFHLFCKAEGPGPCH